MDVYDVGQFSDSDDEEEVAMEEGTKASKMSLGEGEGRLEPRRVFSFRLV